MQPTGGLALQHPTSASDTGDGGRTEPWSVRMAASVMRRAVPFRWHYEHGLALFALERVGQARVDPKYRAFVKAAVDPFVWPDGSIRTYNPGDYNLDQINAGRVLFPLYRATGEERYRLAIALLRGQLRDQPRTSEGGFWHKQIYPHQMWLDGIYMASPFYADYAGTFGEPEGYREVSNQILLMERHARDPNTGLLYHGWDESRQQRWAHPLTGCSPCFWGRAMAWYAMALVDVLDLFPGNHERRLDILNVLQRLAVAVAAVQDRASGLWYQVLDQAGRPGNYLEASASCMFVYTLARGVRQGYLGSTYLGAARRGYQGILDRLIRVETGGLVTMDGICAVAGLGGSPYRDGSYQYYVGEPVVSNDYKGVGPFILASLEMEYAPMR